MTNPRRVAVYCGSSARASTPHRELARDVGAALAKAGIILVYGAGRTGLMGEVADACLRENGSVVGVIPSRLVSAEVAHAGLTELIEVDSMHARKQMMVGLSDAIVALPGGFGTLDELFEAITWRQLGYHDKPVILVDSDGYYDSLLAFLTHAEHKGFLRREHRELLIVVRDAAELVHELGVRCFPRPRLA
jgi:uncharacterized protein (TIGR00730 family)